MYRQESYRAGLASQSEQLLPILRALNWAKSRVPKDAEILDVGCGTGGLLNLIKDKIAPDWGYWGIDISEMAITQGRNLFPHIDLTMTDGGNLKGVKNNALDIIISYGSLEHFYDPEAAIKEIGRILKPGGYFFLMMSGVDKMKPENGEIKEIDVPPHTTGRTTSYLRRPDGLPMQTDVTNFAELIDRGFGGVSDSLIKIEQQFNMNDKSRYDFKAKSDDEIKGGGWDATGQPQWNLSRYEWKQYFGNAGLSVWDNFDISHFKPRHIHPYFFGEK